jgi:hypothetical protein
MFCVWWRQGGIYFIVHTDLDTPLCERGNGHTAGIGQSRVNGLQSVGGYSDPSATACFN